jgi:hypothetical protein
MSVAVVASASSGSQASVASFNIGTLGTGARAGIVFVATHNSATDIVTGVTWNGVAMTLLYRATDTDTEPGVIEAYFLDNVTNGLVTVSRTNNATVTVGYAASLSTASVPAYVSQVITRVASTQNTNADTSTTGTGASGEVAVNDGSPGSSSMRFAAAYTGAATPLGAGTNSTALQSLDSTALGSSFVRETTAGQGSRNVGFATGTTDDYAAVFVAVSEATPKTVTLGLLDAAPTLYAPTLTPTNLITLGLVDAAPALYAPTLAPVNLISLGLLDAGPDLYAPTVSLAVANQDLTIPLVDAGPALYAPTLTRYNLLTIPLLDAAPALTLRRWSARTC